MERKVILLKRSEESGKIPLVTDIEYGEIAMNYANGTEGLFFKNSSDEIVTIKDKKYIDNAIQKLITNTELKFYCIEPVTISINGDETIYDVNTLVDIFLKTEDELVITTTSDSSILALYAWPGALDTYYNWLEGVKLYDGILFDMNDADMYTKWNQGNQGLYGVQFAQYKNCVFWSDNAYISDVALRTNYVLYNSSELPLCYSTIPDNTFKAFYFAYNVTADPNWANQAYKDSFAKATWATQVFSYYGLHSIGLFDMDSTRFNITLPKDCRGLMFYAPNILNAGVFDAINCTNFGAKSGSWRDAFAYCYQLKNLYIKNLMVNLNISWSPISQEALNFILSEAANTKQITISLSPYTYYSLTEANKTLATEKNIVLELITTNSGEDTRLTMLQKTGDGNSFLANDGTYKTMNVKSINGESILGKGDIIIEGGESSYPIVNHGIGDTTITMTPNTFHIWGEVNMLDITLGEETPDICNEYLFQFTSGEEPTTLILPSTVKWVDIETPEIGSNQTYQCSIINNMAIICWV